MPKKTKNVDAALIARAKDVIRDNGPLPTDSLDDYIPEATGEIASSTIADLRARALDLPWDPDQLRTFLAELIDALAPPPAG